MSGFDIAAGAVGFASLGVILLQGCVQGFVLLSTAQNFGQDADLVRCEIEFEQYRLFRWAEKVGLENGSPNGPSRTVNWELINKFLRQLSTLLNETAKFKEEYGLELVTTEEELSTIDLEVPRKGLRKLFASIKPEFHNETARSLQKGNNIWKRMKWAAIDKAGVAVLINDIRGLVDKLYDLLLDNDRDFIRNGIEALLRHVVSQATTSSELSHIEQLLSPKHSVRAKFEESAIKTAVGLKQKRLMLGFSEESKPDLTNQSSNLSPSSSSSTLVTSRPVSPSPGSRRTVAIRATTARGPLSYKLLKRTLVQTQMSVQREMAYYEGVAVLVEWKNVERGVESKLKHRIKSLAALLQDVESSNFRSLNCLGYLKDPGNGNYGYIFKLPQGELQSSMSLTELLIHDTMAPSLNDRIGLSIALAETTLQLHTSGWLHKGVRSDNILFFPQKDIEPDLLQPFLEGYEYARADNPSDMTESPAHQQEANLYRHPALLRSDRPSFQKAFDLYALGCVLIEIGLWADMTTILLHFLRKEKKVAGPLRTRIPTTRLTYDGTPEMAELNVSRQRLLRGVGVGSISEALGFAAGRKFADVVQVCLSAGDTIARSEEAEDDDEDDDDDRCIDLELDILRELRGCRI